MDFEYSAKVRAWQQRLQDFLERHVLPAEAVFAAEVAANRAAGNAWQPTRVMEQLKQRARAEGLWNLFLPDSSHGAGLSNLEYAPLCEIMGRSPLAPEACNCSAPDTGNMEVLERYGTPEQKKQWLAPLLEGKIRSAFAMTEPKVASSDATNIESSIVRDGDHYVINGHKWFCSSAEGAAFAIVMAVTDPDAPPHQRASMFIAPTDAAGWTFVRNIPVMGEACGGYFAHAEIKLEDLRVPASMRLGAEGAGFLLAQERLGPGRIHHCMRWLGICARAQEELCKRALTREIAPGKRLADTQIVQTWIAENAADIACSRALVLQVAGRAETQGFKAAREDVSIIKFQVAGSLQRVLDRTLQAHGALGMTDDAYVAFA
ncbi:MAG: acyl-CoA dehydrogenase family protein, partial [Betaproteobacteria bacterium]|nr:acyl-CoA dehydrogenase family protein [Betaproteobacteria bacterium]